MTRFIPLRIEIARSLDEKNVISTIFVQLFIESFSFFSKTLSAI